MAVEAVRTFPGREDGFPSLFFNEVVQADLSLVGETIILHLCDKATRFCWTGLLEDLETPTVLRAIMESGELFFGPQMEHSLAEEDEYSVNVCHRDKSAC